MSNNNVIANIAFTSLPGPKGRRKKPCLGSARVWPRIFLLQERLVGIPVRIARKARSPVTHPSALPLVLTFDMLSVAQSSPADTPRQGLFIIGNGQDMYMICHQAICPGIRHRTVPFSLSLTRDKLLCLRHQKIQRRDYCPAG